MHLTRHDAICQDRHQAEVGATSMVQRTGARGVELVEVIERSVAVAGLLTLRLLAETGRV